MYIYIYIYIYIYRVFVCPPPLPTHTHLQQVLLCEGLCVCVGCVCVSVCACVCALVRVCDFCQWCCVCRFVRAGGVRLCVSMSERWRACVRVCTFVTFVKLTCNRRCCVCCQGWNQLQQKLSITLTCTLVKIFQKFWRVSSTLDYQLQILPGDFWSFLKFSFHGLFDFFSKFESQPISRECSIFLNCSSAELCENSQKSALHFRRPSKVGSAVIVYSQLATQCTVHTVYWVCAVHCVQYIEGRADFWAYTHIHTSTVNVYIEYIEWRADFWEHMGRLRLVGSLKL